MNSPEYEIDLFMHSEQILNNIPKKVVSSQNIDEITIYFHNKKQT